MLKLACLFLTFAIIGISIYVRMAFSDPKIWHVDPNLTSNLKSPNFYQTKISFDASKLQILENWIEPKLGKETIKILEGDLVENYMTYVARTPIIGFPDYISMRVVPLKENKTDVIVLSRSRFGYSDLGRNKRRVQQWIDTMRQALGT